MSERKYIYGIIPSPRRVIFNQVGIGEMGEVYTINHEDIAAVVSDTSLTICEPTRRNMSAHNQVLEALMVDYTVLPARFGLVSDSEDKLRELLARYYLTLNDYLRRLDNRMEVGVKVFWQKEAMTVLLEGKSQKLTRLKAELQKAPPAKAQALLVEAGKAVKSITQEWQARYSDRIYMRLMRDAVDGRRNYPVDILNILNASFLVDSAAETGFDSAIDELDAECGNWATFRYAKPVPPYNFVNLEMYLQ